MSDSQECRNRAKECFRIAESSPNPLDRQTFSELAAAWLRLANEIDTNQALIEHWGALDRPTDTLTVRSKLTLRPSDSTLLGALSIHHRSKITTGTDG